jgi:hypothetical protein
MLGLADTRELFVDLPIFRRYITLMGHGLPRSVFEALEPRTLLSTGPLPCESLISRPTEALSLVSAPISAQLSRPVAPRVDPEVYSALANGGNVLARGSREVLFEAPYSPTPEESRNVSPFSPSPYTPAVHVHIGLAGRYELSLTRLRKIVVPDQHTPLAVRQKWWVSSVGNDETPNSVYAWVTANEARELANCKFVSYVHVMRITIIQSIPANPGESQASVSDSSHTYATRI